MAVPVARNAVGSQTGSFRSQATIRIVMPIALNTAPGEWSGCVGLSTSIISFRCRASKALTLTQVLRAAEQLSEKRAESQISEIGAVRV